MAYRRRRPAGAGARMADARMDGDHIIGMARGAIMAVGRLKLGSGLGRVNAAGLRKAGAAARANVGAAPP